MWTRHLLLSVLSMPLLAPALPCAQVPEQRALESAAQLLAKGGRAEETRETLATLAALGMDSAALGKLAQDCEKALVAAKLPQREIPEAEGRLREAAACLAGRLESATDKRRLALIALTLDDEQALARLALGHERTDNGWQTPLDRQLLAQRMRVLDAISRAHTWTPEITTQTSDHPLLNGAAASVARWGRMSVHAPWPTERTAQMLREVLRACAVSAMLLDDERGIPEENWFPRPNATVVVLETTEAYQSSLKKALELEWIDDAMFKESRELSGFQDRRGNAVNLAQSDAQHAATMFCWLSPIEDGANSMLKAGHLAFVCQSYLGTPMPRFTYRNDPPPAYGGTYIKPSAEEQKRDEQKLQLAQAGIAGSRAYLAHRIRCGADPVLGELRVDFFGKLSGEKLLKAASFAEFLQEHGTLRPLLRGGLEVPPQRILEAYARGTGREVLQLEALWREWALRESPGIAQRVAKRSEAAGTAPTKPQEELRAQLNALRAKALPAQLKLPAVEFDPQLAPGCRAHAEYLALNPGLGEKYPDAHTETADRPGYSTAGVWAAMHSVIGPTQETAQATLQQWMASFYHRLPLLDPGLVRIGFGANKQYTVVDALSLRRPLDQPWIVVWPHEDMAKVPLNCVGEVPSPVPGVDPATLGYPITVQLGPDEPTDPGQGLQLTLYLGDKPVDCWLTGPEKPLNPELVPVRSWAALPKQPLKAGQRYTVVAEWVGSTRKKVWSFRT